MAAVIVQYLLNHHRLYLAVDRRTAPPNASPALAAPLLPVVSQNSNGGLSGSSVVII